MLTEAWVGLDEEKTEENDEYNPYRKSDIHVLILLISYSMQIQCPPLTLVT
jgi:hypothetical protein